MAAAKAFLYAGAWFNNSIGAGATAQMDMLVPARSLSGDTHVPMSDAVREKASMKERLGKLQKGDGISETPWGACTELTTGTRAKTLRGWTNGEGGSPVLE